jgi:hypothetical protein
MNLNDFLIWLVGSGGAVIAASWIFERIPWFVAKTADFKEWFFFGVVSIIWAGAYAVLTYVPADIIAAIQPWFLGISGLFVTVVVGKIFHKADKIDK